MQVIQLELCDILKHQIYAKKGAINYNLAGRECYPFCPNILEFRDRKINEKLKPDTGRLLFGISSMKPAIGATVFSGILSLSFGGFRGPNR